jgi:hypothetical protein
LKEGHRPRLEELPDDGQQEASKRLAGRGLDRRRRSGPEDGTRCQQPISDWWRAHEQPTTLAEPFEDPVTMPTADEIGRALPGGAGAHRRAGTDVSDWGEVAGARPVQATNHGHSTSASMP